jgi:FMN phosphatase YigB (HAD superfamily)
VFTASVTEHAARCIQLLGLTECFADHPIIDVRATQFYTKHDAEAYLLAAKCAGQNDMKQCYIVDDSTSNIRAAKKVGWNTVLVGFTSRDGKDMRGFEYADHVIDTLHDLPSVWPHLFAAQCDIEEKKVPEAAPKEKKKTSRSKKRRKAD